MSVPGPVPIPRSRWMDWQPKGPSRAETPESDPTKPSKGGSVGSEGTLPAEVAIITPEHEHSPRTIELSVMAGSLDSSPGSAQRFEISGQSHGAGKFPVDSSPHCEQFMSWAEWKAATLNRLFLEQGSSGQPGRITADTVRHGERTRRPRDSR